MIVLRLLETLAILSALWAVWVRRDSLHSAPDAPITIAIALFACGAVLDSAWPTLGAASLPITGTAYLLTTLGHICYLAGAAMGLKTVWLRLLADDAIGPFMSTRILPLVLVAGLAMLTCVLMSPRTSGMRADSLYQVDPDGWLIGYWAAYFGTMTTLNAIAVYGGLHLRRDPRSVMVDPLVAATAVGTLACVGLFIAIASGHSTVIEQLAWPACYVAIIAGSLACAQSWRHRIGAARP